MQDGWTGALACADSAGTWTAAGDLILPLHTDTGTTRGLMVVAGAARAAVTAEVGRDLAQAAADMLALHATENDRTASEARYRTILESAGDPIITIDSRGLIQDVNPATLKAFGYSRDELLGRNVSILMPESHASGHDGYLHRYMETGRTGIIGEGRRVEARRKDGTVFPVDLVVTEFTFGGDRFFTGMLRDVTAREALEESQRQAIRLLTMAEQVGQLGHWRLDLHTRHLAWSPQVYDIHGVTNVEFAPAVDTALAFYHPDDRQRVKEAVAACMEEGTPFAFEARIRRADGVQRHVFVRGQRLRGADGEPIAVFGVFQDITDRLRMAEELRASEERLNRSQTFANIGSWEWNIETGTVFWTERVAALLGHAPGETEQTYDNFLAVVHPDDRAPMQDAIQACLDNEQDYEFEHRVIWPDGRVRWMLERGNVVRDGEGRPTRMLGVVQDITRAKEAELALRESEARLAAAIDNVADGFILFDEKDRVVLWNEQFLRLLPPLRYRIRAGMTFRRLLEVGVEAGLYAEALGDAAGWVARRMALHAQPEELFELELSDGRWLRISERRMPNGWRVGIRADITELRRARAEAQAANRAKSEFLSNMSHELRTPLNAILGFGQFLQMSPDHPLTETQNDHVEQILTGGRHLLELINEVLDLAKVEAGRIDFTFEPLDAARLVDECLALTAMQAKERGIAVSARLNPHPPPVRSDYTRLKQVLLNLISNAVKYNRREGRVTVSAEPRDRFLRIVVEDSGHGIAEDRLSRLFTPFDRLGAEGGDIEGTGLGLPISKTLIEQMGGAIGVSSQRDIGTRFWIDVPLADGVTRAGA